MLAHCDVLAHRARKERGLTDPALRPHQTQVWSSGDGFEAAAGVNSQLSRVKETLLYTSCKVFYPQMTLEPCFVCPMAGGTHRTTGGQRGDAPW